MRVAVLGSWRPEDVDAWDLIGSAKAFEKACRQIGKELVKRGHSLIVGTDSLHTADGQAALGAYEELVKVGTDRPRITVVRLKRPIRTHAAAFDTQRRAHGGIFVDHRVDAASWAAVKLVQAQLADAVVLVGGAEKTQHAGLTTAVAKKPLACIGSFGGAAFKLNELFKSSPSAWGYQPEDVIGIGALQEPFDRGVLREGLERAWIADAPKIMIIHGRSTDRNLLKKHLSTRVGDVMVLADEFNPTEPIPLKLERFASSVDGAIALLTPDDFGGLVGDSGSTAKRARENVWVEVGWFWGRRGRSKLLLLKKGDVTIPSDLLNVETYSYDESPLEAARVIDSFIAQLRTASDVKRR